ncbi:MAG: secretin N-terminal domain-containing protein [Thermoguttaceae bacterium]
MTAWLRQRKYVIYPSLLVLVAAVLAGLCAWLTLSAHADDPGESDFESYPLQHARAADIQATLSSLLPEGTEVAADSRTNRIMVRGPAESHQLAQRTVKSLDQAEPASSKAAVAPAEEPVFQVYQCDPSKLNELAAALGAEFGSSPAVRIVPDQRTSKILVLAPAAVQGRVAERLGRTEPAVAMPRPGHMTGTPRLVVSAASPGLASGPAPIQLAHTTAPELEAALLHTLGERLMPLSGPSDELARFRLTLKGEAPVDLAIDRRTNRVQVTGRGLAADSLVQLVRTLDSPEQRGDQTTRLIPLAATRPADARRAIAAIRTGNTGRARLGAASAEDEPLGTMLSRLFQPNGNGAAGAAEQKPAAKPAETPKPEAAEKPKAPIGPEVPKAPPEAEEAGGLVGPVEIQLLEGLDVIVIRGHRRDVEAVRAIIQQIEALAKETEPTIEVYLLEHVDCQALSTLVNQVYQQVYQPRQGAVFVTALVRPNALLLVGRKENVDRVIELVKRLDFPVAPEAHFQVFFLKHATATTVQTAIQALYPQPGAPAAPGAVAAVGGLAPQVRVIADFRTNAIIVQANPRDMLEVASLIARIDTMENAKVNELRIFPLRHTWAETAAQVLEQAIRGQAVAGGVTPTLPGAAPTPAAARPGAAEQPSTMLQFITVDAKGRRLFSSGILVDVRITPDARTNSLLVSAPAESMPLIEAVIREMDQPPAMRAEIKVFKVVNSDVTVLVQMLDQLFGQAAAAAPGAVVPAVQTAAKPAETSLVPLRFTYDARTNSIIAVGTVSDLNVVEALIIRLDGVDVRRRESRVFRLKNAPATDVATAIDQFLQRERQVEQIAPNLITPFEMVEREVIVVAEPVSNALIVSATPRYFTQVSQLVEELDRRPPMVMIQVLIAEVQLTDSDEFGIELGLQDQVLFNRGLPPDPGFAFNGAALGNTATDLALSQSHIVGTQGVTNLALGRANGQLGYGGLVLSASSESVSVLLRALKYHRRLQVLGRPHIMTLDNQSALIQVGQRVPMVVGVSLTAYGQTNQTSLIDTGLILGVTPRISPDGLVVMEIDAVRSDVGPEAEGIPISISPTGQVIRSPRINQTMAMTTVAAASGQTVVLGGLISTQNSTVRRQVPYLADVPLFGPLFRFDQTTTERSELLIFMTPHVVRNEEDAEALKKTEAARMHWCLSDVIDVYGEAGLRGRRDEWTDEETQVIYPDLEPGVPGRNNGSKRAEPAPEPEKTPFRLEERLPEQTAPNPAPRSQSDQPGAWAPPDSDRPAPASGPAVPARLNAPSGVTAASYNPAGEASIQPWPGLPRAAGPHDLVPPQGGRPYAPEGPSVENPLRGP